jgi:hypothetical protein
MALPVDQFTVWPADDSLRLLYLLTACSAAPLLAACHSLQRQFSDLVAIEKKATDESVEYRHSLEMRDAMQNLEHVLAESSHRADTATGGEITAAPPTLEGMLVELTHLEKSLHTEMRFIYGPDWDLAPGKLTSKKGTWVKPSTCFSWEIREDDKLYVPHGVVMPVLQIGRIFDPVELQRHDWGPQHLHVWVKEPIIKSLAARRGVWFIYGPHWEDNGLHITTLADTWLKRSCQMSGELQPFELIYVPKGLVVELKCPIELVEEQWEKFRHAHVHQHRRVTLARPPLTVKQDKYDIFVGQSK